MKKIAKLCVAILSVTAFTGMAYAAKSGSYVGAGLGASNQDIPKNYYQLYSGTAPATASIKQSNDNNGIGGRLFAGYNFNQYVGIEAGLAHYATADYSSTISTASTTITTIKTGVKNKLNTFDVVGKGYLPLGNSHFNLYGLAGLAYVNSKAEYNLPTTQNNLPQAIAKSKTNNALRPIYGIGASYDVPDSNLTTNIEWSHIQGKGNLKTSTSAIPSANLVSLNLAYNFG